MMNPSSEQTRSAAQSLIRDADSLLSTIERQNRTPSLAEDERLSTIMQRAKRLTQRAQGEAVEGDYKASKLFRAIRCLAQAKGNLLTAINVARLGNDPEVGLILRAAAATADSSTAAWAGEMVGAVLGEFIPLLRQRAALFALATPAPLRGSVEYPRMSVGSTSGFVAEGAAIPAKQNTLDSITLIPYKAAGMVSVTNELFRRADAYAESAVTGPLADDIALGVDQVFLSNSAAVADTSPAGILHSSNAATAITATVGGTAAACAADLVALLTAGAAFLAPRLLIHPTAIATALGLSGANNYPIIVSLATGRIGAVEIVPAANLPAIDTLVLLDADCLLVASDGLQLDVSTNAAIYSDTDTGPPYGDFLLPASGGISMFQRDMVAVAVKLGITWRSKRVGQVQHIASATWV